MNSHGRTEQKDSLDLREMLTATLGDCRFFPGRFFSKDSILLSAFQSEYGGRNVGYALYGFGCHGLC